MAKSSNSKGLINSGIFGFFGTTINCDSTDTSIYCSIMKLFNLLHRPERKMRQNAVMIYIFYNYVSGSFLNVPL